MYIKDKLKIYFGKNLRKSFLELESELIESAEEIRIRLDKPIIIRGKNSEYFWTSTGLKKVPADPIIAKKEDIKQMLELMSDYSIYSLEEELKNSFITLNGGFRIGITGKTVIENNDVKAIKNITGLNIRICREVKGCANNLFNSYNSGFKNTLIISPPNCGKTTMLRDLIRQLSDFSYTVGLVDERSEIAGCYMGVPQNDVGIRTDIFDRCPKSVGMMMLLRSMSPQIIAVDEICSKKDILSLEEVCNSGIKLLCTVHGENISDLRKKSGFDYLLEQRIFERFFVLDRSNGPGTVCGAFDTEYKELKL